MINRPTHNLLDLEIDPSAPIESRWQADLLNGVVTVSERGSSVDTTAWHMLVLLTGRERTEVEYGTLLGAGGLEQTRGIPTSSEASIVEGIPAYAIGTNQRRPTPFLKFGPSRQPRSFGRSDA
jgi:hypothetical protein